ncbi:putative toxin-antitoxin system toxin component, PIN family [Thermodesulfobacteriota bacterium]
MRIVLDTNVFISGIFFSGSRYQILKAWQDGKAQLVISREILDEYQRVAEVLSEQFPGIDFESILYLITSKSDLIVPQELSKKICDDPDDDKFLACAIAGKVKIIVSGDKHLLKVSGYSGVEVVRPRRFLDDYVKIAR